MAVAGPSGLDDDCLPRLETLEEVLSSQASEDDNVLPQLETQEILRSPVSPGPSRKRPRDPSDEVILKLRIRNILQPFLENGPIFMRAPLDRALADIDGREPEPDTWQPKKKCRTPAGSIEEQADVDAMQDLLDLVADMRRDAVGEQKNILDELATDLKWQMHRLPGTWL